MLGAFRSTTGLEYECLLDLCAPVAASSTGLFETILLAEHIVSKQQRALGLTVLVCLLGSAPHHKTARWEFEQIVDDVHVVDSSGTRMSAPFLGGFNSPRPQLVDIDGDQDQDLFVLDATNNLEFFENINGEFRWRPNRFRGLRVGEWFRFVDINRDGAIDLLCGHAFGYISYFLNTGSARSAQFGVSTDSVRNERGQPIGAEPQSVLDALDIDGDGRLDLFLGRTNGTVSHFEQISDQGQSALRFRLAENGWKGIQITGTANETDDLNIDTGGPYDGTVPRRHGANALAFGKLGRENHLALLWGDYFERGLLVFDSLDIGIASEDARRPRQFSPSPALLTSGYNAATIGDVNGDHIPDVVVGVVGGAFDPSTTEARNLFLVSQGPVGTFRMEETNLISMLDVGSESAPTVADIDGDGDLDIVIGNRVSPSDNMTATLTWIENIGTSESPSFRERGNLGIKGEFNYAPSLVDLDNDGLLDLLLGTWTNRVEFYKNTGTKQKPKWTMSNRQIVQISRGSNTTPTAGDIDGDGLLDLVVGEAIGDLNVYRNIGTQSAPKFELVSDHFQDIRFARRSAPHLVDLNHDGRADLIVGQEDGNIELWLNVGKKEQFEFTRDTTFVLKSDYNSVPVVVPLEGANRWTLVAGGRGGGLTMYRIKQ